MISSFYQFKNDFYKKLHFSFKKGKTIVDAGCGDGMDGVIFPRKYGLRYYGFDVFEHENIKKFKLNFRLGSIFSNPFIHTEFDYVFAHDLLHHVDEGKQRKEKHIQALHSLRRMCKPNGYIIIIEGNRYNPLFYPHMVRLCGHEHFRQSYFVHLISEVYPKDKKRFHFFEAHAYPSYLLPFCKMYEFFMEHLSPKMFLAYNVSIILKSNT